MCTEVAKNPVPRSLFALDYWLALLAGCLPRVGVEEFPHLAATTS